MSKNFELLKEYYEEGLWSKAWIWDAVPYKWLTAEEYQLITGEEWDADNRPVEE